MAKGMTFQAVLKLQKQQFDKGIRDVQKQLGGLQKSFLSFASSFGAGLGIYQLVGSLRTTAQQLSVVQATLENVSETTLEYGENLEFIKKIAKEYGQDQNALIGSFAKMRAAAGAAGVDLNTIKTTYEALTRAAGAYHLSADQTANAMMAVEQMFSKGTVMSEELRRQLANSLPAAISVFAKAAGRAGITVNGTVAELQKAMKAGEVMTKDIMPYVAEVLNEQTKNANFDSLQASLNRFRNTWYEFTENTKAEKFFDRIFKAGEKALGGLGKAMKAMNVGLGDMFIGSFAGVSFINTYAKIKKLRAEAKAQEEALTVELAKQEAILKRQTAAYEKKKASLIKQGFTERVDETGSVSFYGKTRTHEARDAEATHRELMKTKATINEVNAALAVATKNTKGMSAATMMLGRAWKAVRGLISTTLSMAGWTLLISVISGVVNKLIDWYNWQKKINSLPTKGVEDAKAMSEETAKTFGELEKNYQIYSNLNNETEVRKKALDDINKQLGLTGDKMLTIGEDARKVEQAIKGWERGETLKKEQDQLNDALVDTNAKIIQLEAELDKIKDSADYGKTMKVVVDDMGTSYERLTSKASELLKEEKKINQELAAQKALRDNLIAEGAATPKKGSEQTFSEEELAVKGAMDDYSNAVKYLENQLENGRYTQAEFNKEVGKAAEKTFDAITKYKGLSAVVKKLGTDTKTGINYSNLYDTINANRKNAPGKGSGKGTKAPEDEMKKALDDYIKERAKLDNQLKNMAITTGEYVSALDKEHEKIIKLGGGYSDLASHLKTLGKGYEDIYNDITSFSDTAAGKMGGVFEHLNNILEDNVDQMIEKFEEQEDAYTEAVGLVAQGLPTMKKRDSFFDYKKKDYEIWREGSEAVKDYYEKLKELQARLQEVKARMGDKWTEEFQAFLDIVVQKLTEAGFAAETFKQKADFAELKKDVKDFKRELQETQFDSLKNVATSFDRLVQGIESVGDALEKLDVSVGFDTEEFDKLRAITTIVNELIQVWETYMSIMEGVRKVEEAKEAYEKAATAQKVLNAKTQIAAEGAVATAESASAAKVVAAETTKQAASQKTTIAAAGEAVAGAASSQASIPFVGPILAAAAAITILGVLTAALAKTKGFAKGGIVPGSSYSGDNNVIRANSGEMILTGKQQKNLFDAINSGNLGGGKEMTFRLRGTDIIGAIKNTESKMRG